MDGKNVVCTLEIEGGTQHVVLKPQTIPVEKFSYNEQSKPVAVTAVSCPNCAFIAEDKSFESKTQHDQNTKVPETKESPRQDRRHRRVLGWCRGYHRTIIDENIKTMVQIEDERSVKLYENSTDEEKLRLAQTRPYWLNVYADEDIEMIPHIEKDDNKLSLWKDVKELLFPRCQDPCCVIVLSCLKKIFKYPTDLRSMHSCTEQEQNLFMRRFKMVHLGSLLVSLISVREKIDYLTELVENRHKGSKAKCWYGDVQCLKCMSKPRIKTATERRTETRNNRRPNTANGSLTQLQLANKEQISLPALYLPEDVAQRIYTSSVSSLGPDVEEDTVEFPVMLTCGDVDILVPCSILTHVYPQCYNILTYYSNNLIVTSFTNNQIVQATARQAAAFNYWMDIQDNHTALPLFTSGSLMMKLSDFSLASIGLLPLQTRQFLLVTCDWTDMGDNHSTSGIGHDEGTLCGNVTPCSEGEVRFYDASCYDIYDDQLRVQPCEKAAEDSGVHELERKSQGRRNRKEASSSGMKLVKKKTLRVFDKEPVSPLRSPRKSKFKQKKKISMIKNPHVKLFTEQNTLESNSLPIPSPENLRIKSGKKAVMSSRYKSPYLVQPFVKKLPAETKVGNFRSYSPYSPKVITSKHRETTRKMPEPTDQIEKESGNITRKVQLRPKPVNICNMAKWPKKTTSQPLPFRNSTAQSPEASYSQNNSLVAKTALKNHTGPKESPGAMRSNVCAKLRKEWREKHMRENSIKVSRKVNEEPHLTDKITSCGVLLVNNLKNISSTDICFREDLSKMVCGSNFRDDNSSSNINKTNTVCDSFKGRNFIPSTENKSIESSDRGNSLTENQRHLSCTSDQTMKETEMSLHDVCNRKDAGNSPTPPWEAYNLQLDDRQSHPHRFNTGMARNIPQTMSQSPSTKAYDFGGSNTIYDEYSISASTSVYAASSTSSVQFNQENSQQFEFCLGRDPSLQDADTTLATPYSRQMSSGTMAIANMHNENTTKNTSETAIKNSESSKHFIHQTAAVRDSASIDPKIPGGSLHEGHRETGSKMKCATDACPKESSTGDLVLPIKSAVDESVIKTTENAEVGKQHHVNEITGKYVFIPDILNITGIIVPDKPSNKPNLTPQKKGKTENKGAEKPKIKEMESNVSSSEIKKPQHIQIHSCMELHSPQRSLSSPQQSASTPNTEPDHLKQSPRKEVQGCTHETLVGRSCPEFSTAVSPKSGSTKTPRPVYVQYDVKARRSAGAILQGPNRTRPFFYRNGFIPGKISKISGSVSRQYRAQSCQLVSTNGKLQRDTSDTHAFQRANNATSSNSDFLTIKGTASFASPSRGNKIFSSTCPDCTLNRDTSNRKTEQAACSSRSHNTCCRRSKVYIAPSPSTESMQTAPHASENDSFLHMYDPRLEEMFESDMYQGNQNLATWEAASNYLAAAEQISNLRDDLKAISLHSYKRRLSANPIRSLSLCRKCSAKSESRTNDENVIQPNATEKETDHESSAKTKSKKQTAASKIVNVVFQYHHENKPRRATTAYMPSRVTDHSLDMSAAKERPHTCDPRQRTLKPGQKLQICIDLMNGTPRGKQLTDMSPLEIKKIDI